MKKCAIRLVYNRHNRLTKDGVAAIHVDVNRSGVGAFRKFINTGVSVEPSLWDEKNSCISKKHPNSIHLNKIVRDFISGIEDYEYSLMAQGKVMTEELLDNFLESKGKQMASFTEFFQREIDPLLKRGTRKEHTYTLHLLSEFRPNLLFSDINLTFIQEFDRFLRTTKGLSQNTVYKHHQHINRFIRLADQKELYSGKNPYTHFKVKKELSNRINLSLSELQRLEGLTIGVSYPELILIRDMFLFSCYTGLRFSDVDTLEYSHLVDSNDGLCIVKKMEKVPKPVTLPLTLLFEGKPFLILQKYLKEGKGKVFPSVSNQHANRSLKILAGMANVDMRLTFHISRHTFGSMLAEITQNPYLIMDLMGHGDIKTSMIYIHRSQERINKQLRKVNWSIL